MCIVHSVLFYFFGKENPPTTKCFYLRNTLQINSIEKNLIEKVHFNKVK